MPLPMGQEGRPLPPNVQEIVTKARTSWLKNAEVLDILLKYKEYGLQVGTEAPNCPVGGCLFLFNRRLVRFFRKDGHRWRKKSDGKTVRETHEKLKIDNKDALNCYYAHAEATTALQRRCYWLLEGEGDIVLVHYLSSNPFPRAPSAALLAAIAHPSAVENGCLKVPDFGLLLDLPGLESECMHTAQATGKGGILRSDSAPSHFPVEALQAAVTITTGRSSMGEGASPSAGAPAHRTCSCHLVKPLGLQECQLHSGVGRAASLPTFCNGESNGSGTAAAIPTPAGSTGFPSATFPGATVQTGFTVPTASARQQGSLQDSRHSSQSAVHDGSLGPDTLAGPSHSDVTSSEMRLCTTEIVTKGGQPPADASVANAGLKPSADRESAELHCDLKPAMSLTRVDSDTLRVAPSLSRATSGAPRASAVAALGAREPTTSCPVLPSSIFSPFYSVAFSGKPIEGLENHPLSADVPRAFTAPAAPSEAPQPFDNGLLRMKGNTMDYHVARDMPGMRPRKRHCGDRQGETEGSEVGGLPAELSWDAGLGLSNDRIEPRLTTSAAASRELPWLDLHPSEMMPGSVVSASEGRSVPYLSAYLGHKASGMECTPQALRMPNPDLLYAPNGDLDWDLTF